MDVRNIKQEPEVVTSELLLPKVFEYNLQQLEVYKGIEDLPDWPFDVNNPGKQKILKDFIGNVIEELTEGIESINKMSDLMEEHGFNINILSDQEKNDLCNNCQNANEEQADALGFFLTLFEFSNIGPEDLLSYKDCKDWEEIFKHGVAMQVKANNDDFNYKYRKFKLLDPTVITPGFNELTPSWHFVYKIMVFEVIYHLSVARNLLKSRIWKQTPVMTKELEYQEELVKAFYLYMGFLAFAGFTPESYYKLFFKKQQLNKWRVASGY